MNRWLTSLCILLLVQGCFITGCSSIKDEVASSDVANTPAPAEVFVDTADAAAAEIPSDVPVDPSVDTSADATTASPDPDAGVDVVMATELNAAAENPEAMTAVDGAIPSPGDGSEIQAAPVKPKNLKEQAEQAFLEGQEKAAYWLIQAHLLASSVDAPQILANYQWSPARKQPQLGARIAVGVTLTAPSDAPEYKPIGSLSGFFSSRKPTPRGKKGDAGIGNVVDDNAASSFVPPNDRERIVQKYAGLMGDVLVDYVRNMHKQGKLAPVFQTLSGVGGNDQLEMAGDGSGNFNSSLDGSDGGIMSSGKSPLDTKVAGAEAKYISIGPALTYIGNDSQAKLIDLAKAGEFDILVIFDVDVTVNLKLRMIYNECKVKLITLMDGKSVATSKLLKNVDAQKEIDKTGIASVESAMKPVLTKLEESVAMVEIPSFLTSEIIKSKRMGTLITDKTRSKLASLSEIKLYRNRNLLNDQELGQAFETILGPTDGKLLATGSEDERLTVVKKLLSGP